jgi:hypothetical protein
MGLEASEAISGFIYIGTVNEPPQERLRPNVESLQLNWTKSTTKKNFTH